MSFLKNISKTLVATPSSLFITFAILVVAHLVGRKNGLALFGIKSTNTLSVASLVTTYSNAVPLSCSATSNIVREARERKRGVSIVLLADAEELSRASLFFTSLRAFAKKNSFKELLIVCPDEHVSIYKSLVTNNKLLGMSARVLPESHFVIATSRHSSSSSPSLLSDVSGPNGAIRALMPLLVSSALDTDSEFYLVLEPDTIMTRPVNTDDLVKSGRGISNEQPWQYFQGSGGPKENSWYSLFLGKVNDIRLLRKYSQQGPSPLIRQSVWEASEMALFGHEIDSSTKGDAERCPYLSNFSLGQSRRTFFSSTLNPELQPFLLSRSISTSTMCALQRQSFSWLNDLFQSYPEAKTHRRDGSLQRKKTAYWGVYALYWLHSHCTSISSSSSSSSSLSQSSDDGSVLLFDSFHQQADSSSQERSILGPQCCAWSRDDWISREKWNLSEALNSSTARHLFSVIRGSGRIFAGNGTFRGDISVAEIASQVVPFFEKAIREGEASLGEVDGGSKVVQSLATGKTFLKFFFGL